MASEIGTEARIPNPALRPFDRFIGEWRTSGAHPGVPDTILHGRVSYAWLEGGAFLICRTQIDHPLFPSGIMIFGSDDAAGSLFVSYFDERGISRKYDVTLVEGGFVTQRTDPKFSQRASYILAADGNSVVTRGQMSRDGGAWEDDLSLTYERA